MNIANKSGVYKDFSGKIKWESTACGVRNADFEILEKENDHFPVIVFADAVFVSGKVWSSVIKNGLNLGCKFCGCEIEYMINKGGEINCCDWHDGIFEDGIFICGIWYDGIWISGEWDEGKNSSGIEMESTPDKWGE